MPYMGKVDVKASDIKRFAVTGSTSATHVLSWTAPSEQSLIITINGVKQQDGAYTIAGTPTTITLSSALVATDEMEVIGINDIGQTNTVAQDSVVTDMIRDNAVTTAKIADDQVTSAKLANAINIVSGNSLIIDSGAVITNNGTATGFGGGKVLQVVGANYSSQASTTSTSFVATGLSASITPSSSSNKILVMFEMPLRAERNGFAYATLYRDATNLGNSSYGVGFVGYQANAGDLTIANIGTVYLDSPATTSAITYYVYFRTNGITGYSCISNATATLTLMEIAA